MQHFAPQLARVDHEEHGTLVVTYIGTPNDPVILEWAKPTDKQWPVIGLIRVTDRIAKRIVEAIDLLGDMPSYVVPGWSDRRQG